MSWIKTIPFAQAEGRLRALYERVKGPDDSVDQILQAHGLRPHTLEGHMALYKSVLHHSGNRLPKWLLETVGVRVSLLNDCSYCVEHHFAGLRRLLRDDRRADAMRAALETGSLAGIFKPREIAILVYAEKLTRAPETITAAEIEQLRASGLDDGEILEVNQVTSYFAYANRTVLGLGVTTGGDTLGLSPGDSEDPLNWQHA
ncbi:MAG: peroxidase-related enzyme [Chthoniobacterales bacterium]|nr:peroxidase-related enzyme [Chthoniobacterales bacterium]